jgi:uncharacterized protein Yka (UPF0111/DUF47 family)
MDVMEMIDKQLESARDKLYDIHQTINQLERKSYELYEKKLDMMVKGYSADRINQYLLAEWQKILSRLSAIAYREE